MTRLRYREAAAHFAAAANRVPVVGETERIDYLGRQATALYRQGDEFGDNSALRSAADAWCALLILCPRERAPLDWAMTQNNLGAPLQVLGQRGDDAALHRAVAAYEAALLERTRERAPLDWAVTQNNLGNALQVLGERGDDEALRRAVAAFEAALNVMLDFCATAYVAVIEQNLARARALLS
jgi:Asp-tRNA(Asn)/Glu-tRNA(Gln) amidotransferase A subunit family amidase